MGLLSVKNAVAPYLLYLKLGATLALLSVCFAKGCSYGEQRQEAKDHKQIAALQDDVGRKGDALRRAAGTFSGLAKILRDIDQQTQKRVAEEAAARQAAFNAGAASARAQQRMRDSNAAFDARVRAAQRDATCKALLDLDLSKLKECGL